MIGPIIPGMVPARFIKPIITPENLGAISMIPTGWPAICSPPAPTPTDNKNNAVNLVRPK